MTDPVTDAIDHQVNSKRIEEVDDCLAPTDQILMSIAVSLKRIADALGPQPDLPYKNINDLLFEIADRTGTQ